MRYLLLLLLCGCTMIDQSHRVEGWPEMRQDVRVVSQAEMHAHCDKYAGFMEVTFACSEMFLAERICRVWVTKAGGWTEAHERKHCEGYEHIGGNGLKVMLANNKKE